MSRVVDLVDELAGIASLISTREALRGKTDQTQQLATNMVSGFCAKLKSLDDLSSQSAVTLYNALAAASLDEQLIITIEAAIDERMALPPVAPRRGAGTITTQHLLYPTRVLTQKDWDRIDDPKTGLMGEVQVITDRYGRLGVTHPSEQTIKWIVALLVAKMSERSKGFPKYKSIWHLVNDVKNSFESSRKAYPYKKELNYPETPAELSQVVYDYAYDHDDPPITVDVQRINQIANGHVPLRGNSKLLTNESCNAQPSGSSGYITRAEVDQLMSRGNGKRDQLAITYSDLGGKRHSPRGRHQLALADGPLRDETPDSRRRGSSQSLPPADSPPDDISGERRASPSRDASSRDERRASPARDAPSRGERRASPSRRASPAAFEFRPKPRKYNAAQDGSVVPPPAAAPGVGPHGGAGAEPSDSTGASALNVKGERITMEAIEAASMNALTKRTAKRAAAAKKRPASAMSKPKSAPKPKAAPKGKAKAKAAPRMLGSTRGACTSRAYDTAVRRALAAGKREQTAKDIGRKAYATAAKQWDRDNGN